MTDDEGKVDVSSRKRDFYLVLEFHVLLGGPGGVGELLPDGQRVLQGSRRAAAVKRQHVAHVIGALFDAPRAHEISVWIGRRFDSQLHVVLSQILRRSVVHLDLRKEHSINGCGNFKNDDTNLNFDLLAASFWICLVLYSQVRDL